MCTDDPDLCAQMTLHPLGSYSEVTLTGKHTDNIVVVSTLYCGILRHMPVLFILVNFSAAICLHSGHAFFIKRRCAAVAKCHGILRIAQEEPAWIQICLDGPGSSERRKREEGSEFGEKQINNHNPTTTAKAWDHSETTRCSLHLS